MMIQKNIGRLLIILSLLLLVILTFVKIEIDKRDEFLCESVHTNPSLSMDQCPVHESNYSWLIVLSFVIAFGILAGGLYLEFMPASPSSVKDQKKIDVSKLSEEEKTVYEIIKKNEGSVYQSDLIKDTAFSKVHITRILDRLETKGILERKRRGMTNIIILR